MSAPDLSEAVGRIRELLASEEYPSEGARRVALRALLHETCVGLTVDEIGPLLEAVRSQFPDRTYESSSRAAALEREAASAQRENRKLAADVAELTAQLRGYQRLSDQLYAAVQQAGGTGQALLGGSSAQAPRDPAALAPLYDALARIVGFVVKQEQIALSVEESMGRRAGRAIDGDSLGDLLRGLLRSEGSALETFPGKTAATRDPAIPRIEAKLGYLGLLPAAMIAAVQQSWRGGTTAMLQYLEPNACERDVPAKIPGLRDVAVLREVRRRFEEFWGDLDRNMTHYYRGTFETVYAEKMEDRG
jgi:hypothetical protein